MEISIFGFDRNETLEEAYLRQEREMERGRRWMRRHAGEWGWREFRHLCQKWYINYPRGQAILRKRILLSEQKRIKTGDGGQE